jgi:hypothetical protein
VQCRLAVPRLPAGEYIVELDCVASHVAWFAPLGSRVVRLSFDVPEP